LKATESNLCPLKAGGMVSEKRDLLGLKINK